MTRLSAISLLSLSTFVLVVLALAWPCQAGTVWDADGGSGNRLWGTPSNWDGNSVPVFDSSVALEFATAGTSATMDADYTAGTILFNRDAAFTINRSGTNKWVLTLHGGISTGVDQTAGQDYTLTTAIALGNNNIWTVNNPSGGGTNSLLHSYGLPLDLGSYQLTVNGAGQASLSGTIIGVTGSLHKSGSGTLFLGNNSSTFGGGLTVAEGTVGFTYASAAGSGTLNLIGGKVAAGTNSGGVYLNAPTVSISNTVEFGTGLVGNRQLNFTGATTIAGNAVLNFSNVVGNDFQGLTTLNGDFTASGSGAGPAQFSGGLAIGGASRRITIDRSAGTVEFGGPLGGDSAGLDLTVAGSAPGAKVGIYNNPITDAVGKSPVRVIVDAGGTVLFDKDNAYSAGTVLRAGTIKWTGGNVSPVTKGPFGSGTLIIEGGTLANYYNGSGTYLYNTVDVTGSFEYATLDYDRMLGFRGPVTFSGNPTVTHNGNMGASSDLLFTGAVQLNSNVTLAGTHTGELNFNSSGLNLGGVDRTVTFNDAGTGLTTIKSALAGAPARLTVKGSRDLEAYFVGATAHSVEYGGTATYTLRGDTSDYTGGTFISGGATVKLYPYGYGGDTARALPDGSSLAITGPASTFDLADWFQKLGSLTMTGGNVVDSVGTRARKLGLQGNVAGLGSADTATISCLLSLEGATRTFTVADGAAMTDMRISGIISKGSGGDDHAGLVKQGAGRLVLSGANTFDLGVEIGSGTVAAGNNAALGAGTATVKSGGRLEIMEGVTVANALVIEAGGTVGGSGTYLGNLLMPAGSFLDPGSSPGTLTVDGNLTPTPGSALLWELGDTLADFDRVVITGDLILPGHGGGADITVYLSNLAGLNPTGQIFRFVTWAGADPAVGTKWAIDYGTTGWSGGIITGTDNDGMAGGYYEISGLVPEPGTLVLMSLGLVLLRRRR